MNKILDLKFIILAAGNSTRNYPHSLGIPHKSLLPLGSVKIIDYLLNQLIEAGAFEVTLVLQSEDAIFYFERSFKNFQDKIKVNYIIQHKANGLGYAIAEAMKESNDNACIILPDDIIKCEENIFNRIINSYNNHNNHNIFVTKKVDDPSRWGIIENGIFIEKPSKSISKEAFVFSCVLNKRVIAELKNLLINKEKSFDGKEVHFFDTLNKVVKENQDIGVITVPLAPKDIHLDCGTIDTYEMSLLYSLLKMSKNSQKNSEYAKKVLNII